MLFWLTLIALAIGIAWYLHDDWSIWAQIIIVCAGMTVFTMLIIIATQYIGVDAFIEESNTRYEMLTYQVENNFYDNDNEVGKFQLIEKVQDWNEDLSRYKVLQRDLWIGIFIPNIYDQYEFIELTTYK